MDIQEILNEINRHITVLNDDYTQMATSVAILQERVEWLCKFFWLVMGSLVGLVFTQIWQLVLINKKNKDK
jgi:hypothetical protein